MTYEKNHMQHLYIDMIPIPMTHMTTFWLLVRMNPVHCLVGEHPKVDS